MSSFTPFFDPSLLLFQASIYPWIALNGWNQNAFMLFPIEKKQNFEQKSSPLLSQPKKTALHTECSPIQDQYEPQRDLQGYEMEQKKKGGRIQCKGRNDYSNILKSFIHLIKTHTCLKEKIKAIINLKSLPLTYERFLMRIRRKFSRGKTYISPKEIATFLKSCNQSQDLSEKAIGLVFRIVLKNFLSVEYILCLIKSFKCKKQSRKELISKTRQLSKIVFEDELELPAK